jgi:hypothetical protein
MCPRNFQELFMATKARLTPQNVTSLVANARSNGGVDKLMADLSAKGFRAVVEDMFELSDEQRAQLDAVLSKDYDAICRDACLIALRTGGPIRYTVTKAKAAGPRSLRADVECEGDLDELHCGVTIDCPI